MTELAFAAGFASVRQFNHAFRAQLRPRAARACGARGARAARAARAEALALRLPYRPPFDWDGAHGASSPGARSPGVEASTTAATGARSSSPARRAGSRSRRSRTSPRSSCAWRVRAAARICCAWSSACGASSISTPTRSRSATRSRGDPRCARTCGARPGCACPARGTRFELGVRAILGQQVSVRGASTLAGAAGARVRQARRRARPAGSRTCSRRRRCSPSATSASIGLPRARAAAIRGFARAVARGELVLDGARGLDDAVARLADAARDRQLDRAVHRDARARRARRVSRRRPRAAQGARRAATSRSATAQAERLAEAFRPWRSYAAMALWQSLRAAGARR